MIDDDGRWHRLQCAYIYLAAPLALLFTVTLLVACASIPATSRPTDSWCNSNPLPIDLPSIEHLQRATKKVFAHYFPTFPISKDNKPTDIDYYTREYLDPSGEGGKHTAYGGYFRQRPLPVPVGDPQRWQVDNMKTEITRATAAGIDGFTIDILSLETPNWQQVNLAVTAAEELNNGFKIVLMPDGHVLDTDPAELADALAGLALSPAVARLPDGRLIISPFDPEELGVAWWREFLRLMREVHGEGVAFIPCFLDYSKNVDEFNSISYGFSNWGARSPDGNQNAYKPMRDAHDRGKIWMQPVSAQDVRPHQEVFDEANNSENLRLTWEIAIREDADWVQLVTWNDYAEGTEFSPSTHTGWSLLDISSYYLAAFKLEYPPQIVRDVIYISHRTQFINALPTEQTKLINLRDSSSPGRDRVEVLAFLSRPASIRLTTGERVQSFDAPAGVTVVTAELQIGIISAQLIRNNLTALSVDSPFPVQAAIAVQDLQYHFVNSGRSGTCYQYQ